MTVSVRPSDHHVDVLDPLDEARRRPSRSAAVVAAGAAVVLAVTLAVPVVGDANWGEEPAAVPVSLAGTLRLADVRPDAFASGTVLLELPDRELRGEARIDVQASDEGDDARGSFHAWGAVRLLVGSPAVACSGSFGWSDVQDPQEGGGSMHARCDDGAVLAATMVEGAQLPGGRGLTVELRDGWYVAGRASAQAPDPRTGTLPEEGR